MKSAYELAMERLAEDSGPSKSLTDEQKEAIAEIDRTYDARVAEEKMGSETRAAAASFEEAMQIRESLAPALASLEDQREREKQKIWDEVSG
jgi:hypothetical protein